ncbi:interleukin-17 receptor A-like [Branchiostoma floridae]|uniref:Interleukin-17 receptor A-like n=1 Tax=Branchiostoma floridae TaxID=7739 RepID=A0A9J7MSZ9_BRAFL|nr:interleukin-17 receptor A-like [Branchiostoma floridae]
MMLLWRTPVLLLLLLCLASQRSEGARAQRKRKKSNRLETRDMDCSWNCSQQGLPCRVKKECGWWCNAYNNTHCPETPAKPVLHGRGAEPFVFQSGDGESAKYHLGLNVTWEPPDDGSIVFVRGFQVHVMSMNAKDIGWTDCVTLNITGAKLSMADPKRVFYFNCFESEPGIPKRFLPGEKYHIVLYSKPEQGPRHMDQNVSVDITMPDCNARGMEDVEECKDPEHWKPAYINVSTEDSTVNVTFEPAPLTYTIDGYFVWLEPVKDGQEMYQETKVNNCSFPGVPDGTYKVKLRLKMRDCDCYDLLSLPFTVKGPTTPPSEVDFTQLLVAIGGSFAGVLVTGVLVFLMWRRAKLQTGTCTPEDGARPDGSSAVAINNVRPGDVDDDDSSSTVALLQDRPPATNFSVMPVLLIYSHDHRLHEATVRAFAAFLRQQCGCDVTLDDYCMESIARRGKIPWLCQQIKKAKRVILVCSEGTKRIWKDIENAEPWPQPPHPLPCGDMVRPAIHLVTAEFYKSSTFDKYITAYFSYSSEQDVPSALNVGNNYMLMKHFEELYFHLLRWTHRPARPDITMPELGEDQYHLSEAGGELKRCIDEMTAFQAAHPTWFQDSQGSSQACGGGEDTGVQPHNGTPSDVLDITGRHDNHRFGGLYYGSQPDGQCRNDHDYDYDPSPESLVSSFNVSMTNELGMQVNGHFRGQPMIDQSMAGMRRDFSDLDAVCTVPPPPVRNSVDTRMVVPNGGVMEGHANRRASPARAVGHQTIQSGDTSDYSVIPNLATPNPFISPSVALLARHVQQAQATQGGQASEDEGLGTLNVSRTTDV